MTTGHHQTSDDVLAPVMSAILRHPGFNAAAIRYAESVIKWREDLGRFNRVGTNLGFHIINYVMYLDFARRAGRNDHGATISAILDICTARQQCGSRALRTVLTVLTLLGHLRVESRLEDARVRTYVPSKRLTGEATDIYGYAMAVIDELVPGARYCEQLKMDPSFLWRIISLSGRAVIEDGIRITEHLPELDRLISQAGGLPTTISFAHAQMSDRPFPTQRDIAKRFSISPSQVRSVVNGAVEAGLMERSADGAVITASRLADFHKQLIARELALHAKFALFLEDHFLERADSSFPPTFTPRAD